MSYLDHDALDGIGTVTSPMELEGGADATLVAPVSPPALQRTGIAGSSRTRIIIVGGLILLISFVFVVVLLANGRNVTSGSKPALNDDLLAKSNAPSEQTSKQGEEVLVGDKKNRENLRQRVEAEVKNDLTELYGADAEEILAKASDKLPIAENSSTEDSSGEYSSVEAVDGIVTKTIAVESDDSDFPVSELVDTEMKSKLEIIPPIATGESEPIESEAEVASVTDSVREVTLEPSFDNQVVQDSNLPGNDEKILFEVFFSFNQFKLTGQSAENYRQQLGKVESCSGKIIIEGQTCDIGPSSYNKRLGAGRAESVLKLLLEHGISESKIVTMSSGEEKAAIEHHRARENRAIDRRQERKVTVYCRG
ncbi:MAG: OmpA family protein [bacterium]|nr:OmpA family protein [bacterium]